MLGERCAPLKLPAVAAGVAILCHSFVLPRTLSLSRRGYFLDRNVRRKMTSRFEKAGESGELLGAVSARRHCIGFTFIENDDNSTRRRALTLRGRTPAYSFAAATVPLFFFFTYAIWYLHIPAE